MLSRLIRLLECILLRLTHKEAMFAEVDVIILGQQANLLLGFNTTKNTWEFKNVALEQAFNKVQEGLIHAWMTSTPKDSDAREHIYYRMEGLAAVTLLITLSISAAKAVLFSTLR